MNNIFQPAKNSFLQNIDKKAVFGFAIFTIVCFSWAIINSDYRFAAPPVVLLGLAILLTDFRIIYYLLLLSVPYSVEVYFPGGLTLSVFSEPLMLILMACLALSFLLGRFHDRRFFLHPLMVLIYAIYIWSIFTSLTSVDQIKSVKYLLSKLWFMSAFLVFTYFLVKDVSDFRRISWIFLVGLLVLVVSTIIRYAALGFAFAQMNAPFKPFFPNHVIYSTTVALFIPYCFYLMKMHGQQKKVKIFLMGVLAVLVFAVIISYTRASVLSLFVAAAYYLLIRFRITLKTLLVCYIVAIGLGIYFFKDNRYLLHAPNFETTIYNKNFGSHLQATYNFEDVSGMERVYRWIAAIYMTADRPVTGFGPSTFYPEYKRYTVGSFRTYVSDNPEKSTTHNYFLLIMAEQGIPGLVLFVILVTALMVLPEKLYYQTRNQQYRYVILAAGMSLVIVIFHFLLNELIELDKVGSYFFISIALLIRADIWIRDEQKRLKAETEL